MFYFPRAMMHSRFLPATLLALLLFSSFSWAEEPVEKKRLAVMNLKPIEVAKPLASAASEGLRSELQGVRFFTMVERGQMNLLLREHELAQSGLTCAEEDCALEVGKILNAEKILIGSIVNLGSEYILHIRIVDVNSSKVEFAQKKSFRSQGNLNAAVRSLAESVENFYENKYAPPLVRQERIWNMQGGYVMPFLDSTSYLEPGYSIETSVFWPVSVGYLGGGLDFMRITGKSSDDQRVSELFSISPFFSFMYRLPFNAVDVYLQPLIGYGMYIFKSSRPQTDVNSAVFSDKSFSSFLPSAAFSVNIGKNFKKVGFFVESRYEAVIDSGKVMNLLKFSGGIRSFYR